MHTALKIFLAVALTAALAVAGTPVDQGSPGKQGAWPVTYSSPSYPSDGGNPTGVPGVATYPYPCSAVYQATYLMDGGVITVGVAPTSRLYLIACNSRDNTSGNIRCRADADAGVLVTTAGSIGDVLGTGDCISYTNPLGRPVKCIGASTYLTTFECAP